MTSFAESSGDEHRNLNPEQQEQGKGGGLQGWEEHSLIFWTSMLDMQLLAHNLYLSKAVTSKQR